MAAAGAGARRAPSRRAAQPIANAEGIAGETGDPSYDTDLERESLPHTLEAAGVEGMHLVGWSNAGQAVLDLALARPDRVLTLTATEPAAWCLVADSDPGARSFDLFIRDCAGRQITAEDLRRFLVAAGLRPAEVDFTALPAWPSWYSCRDALSWYGGRAIDSARTGIEGLDSARDPDAPGPRPGDRALVRRRRRCPRRDLPDARVLELDGGHASILESAGGVRRRSSRPCRTRRPVRA